MNFKALYLIFLLIIPVIAFCEDNKEFTKIKSFILPTNVEILVNEFGKPSSVILPAKEDPSPWGQWHFWNLSDGSTLTALIDDYTSVPNFSGEVRYIQLSFSPANFNPVSEPIHSKLHERNEMQINKSVKQTVKKLVSGEFWYYYLNAEKSLIGIGRSTFDMDLAD